MGAEASGIAPYERCLLYRAGVDDADQQAGLLSSSVAAPQSMRHCHGNLWCKGAIVASSACKACSPLHLKIILALGSALLARWYFAVKSTRLMLEMYCGCVLSAGTVACELWESLVASLARRDLAGAMV